MIRAPHVSPASALNMRRQHAPARPADGHQRPELPGPGKSPPGGQGDPDLGSYQTVMAPAMTPLRTRPGQRTLPRTGEPDACIRPCAHPSNHAGVPVRRCARRTSISRCLDLDVGPVPINLVDVVLPTAQMAHGMSFSPERELARTCAQAPLRSPLS